MGLSTKEPREVTWHWSFNLIMAGFFIALPVIFVNGSLVLIQNFDLFFGMLVMVLIVIKFREIFRKLGIV